MASRWHWLSAQSRSKIELKHYRFRIRLPQPDFDSTHGPNLSLMKAVRKNMPQELQELQDRLRAVLRSNMNEARRTRALLRETERKVEEQFGHFDFIETVWYNAAKKFRKE